MPRILNNRYSSSTAPFTAVTALLPSPNSREALPFRDISVAHFVTVPELLPEFPPCARIRQGTILTAACQNAAFCPDGSRTLIWQIYSHAASSVRGTVSLRGTALDFGFIPSVTANGAASYAFSSPL